MNLIQALEDRSGNCCELCGNTENLSGKIIEPRKDDIPENQVVFCQECWSQYNGDSDVEPNHWRPLNESMWNETNAVKVVAYRMLKRLEQENWASGLIDMLYLEEEIQEWAEWKPVAKLIHKDAHGNVLETGDTVTLVKDLQVKGSGSFKAKQGYAVRRIRLDQNDAGYIEGKVEGQTIMIKTEFVKKQPKNQ